MCLSSCSIVASTCIRRPERRAWQYEELLEASWERWSLLYVLGACAHMASWGPTDIELFLAQWLSTNSAVNTVDRRPRRHRATCGDSRGSVSILLPHQTHISLPKKEFIADAPRTSPTNSSTASAKSIQNMACLLKSEGRRRILICCGPVVRAPVCVSSSVFSAW